MDQIPFGNRHLPALIDQIAEQEPEKIYLSLARSTRIQDGFEDLSYGRFAQAIDRCAFWLSSQLGHKDANPASVRPIFASLPRHDLRGAILILAAPKTGYQMYWSQPFGASEDILAALRAMKCENCLKPNPCPKEVDKVLQEYPMRILDIPPLGQWLRDVYLPSEPRYPYERDLAKVSLNPWNIYQTSGTTGLPKPIIFRNGAAPTVDNFHRLPELGEKPCQWERLTGKRVLSTFGWYQFAGLIFSMMLPVYYDFIAVMAPELHDWSAEDVDEAHVYGNIGVSCLYPGVLVELAKDEHKLKNLERLDMVVYGGSGVPFWAGNAVVRYTDISQIFGSTEAGLFPMEVPRTREEWPWLRMPPQLGGEYRPYIDNMHQLVIVRQEKLEAWQAAFINFPELTEWVTGDLMVQHQSQPELWRPVGRIVDLLTFSNGRTFNPVPIEGEIAEHPDVVLAMICGESKGRLVVLITPTVSVDNDKAHCFRDGLWPFIVGVFEREGPAWLKDMLHASNVRLTSPARSVQRTGGKWNVNRKKTLKLYRAELEADYGQLDTGIQPEPCSMKR